MGKKFVYADNAATTRINKAAFDAMLPWLTEHYGNPSSIYSVGREASRAVEDARSKVAALLGAKPEEIFFTSGGSEADNWAIKGMAARSKKGKHIISSKFEHHAVLHTLQYLEKQGYEVTYLDIHGDGLVRPEELEAAIRPDTSLITIMTANNEIGTVQPIAELGRIARAHKVPFHTDAVQAVGHIPVDVEALNVDLLSISAHKFHGPKGVGVLYVKKGLRPEIYLHGGAQERGRRATTENVAGIVGMAAALEYAVDHLDEAAAHMTRLRDRLIDGLLEIPYTRLNGDREHRLPGNVNISFQYIEGESILLSLDLVGICGSSGSACTSGSLDPSHVLLALGLPHEIAHGSLRISLSDESTDEDVDYILEQVPPIIERLRAMSPLYDEAVR